VAIGSDVFQVARGTLGDPTPAVDRDLATLLEEVAYPFAAALHPRLHAGNRDADHLCGFLLRQTPKLGQRDRLAVRRREPRHEKRDAFAEIRLKPGVLPA
jgi:hypothetical protein